MNTDEDKTNRRLDRQFGEWANEGIKTGVANSVGSKMNKFFADYFGIESGTKYYGRLCRLIDFMLDDADWESPSQRRERQDERNDG